MAKSHDAIPRKVWAALRLQVLTRDGRRCQKCGKAGALQVDHILASVHGGTNDLSNLQALCFECHRIKTAHDMDTYDPEREKWRDYLRG